MNITKIRSIIAIIATMANTTASAVNKTRSARTTTHHIERKNMILVAVHLNDHAFIVIGVRREVVNLFDIVDFTTTVVVHLNVTVLWKLLQLGNQFFDFHLHFLEAVEPGSELCRASDACSTLALRGSRLRIPAVSFRFFQCQIFEDRFLEVLIAITADDFVHGIHFSSS